MSASTPPAARFAALVGALIATALAVGGCTGSGRPSAVPSRARGSAAVVPPALTPVVGNCYSPGTGASNSVFGAPAADSSVVHAVPCAGPHAWETVFVGVLSAAAATYSVARSEAVPGWNQHCQQSADELLGGDWRGSYVQLSLTLPTPAQLKAGVRWYRCDLALAFPKRGPGSAVTTGSFRDGLRGTRPVAITCVGGSNADGITELMTAAPCSSAHTGEFVGALPVHDGSAPKQLDPEAVSRGCDELVARYLGYPAGETSHNRYVGSRNYGTSDPWQLSGGAFDYHCFAVSTSPDGTMTGSVKGIRAARPGA